jgi:hypothetical protein
MAFDVEGARRAGYSDAEIADHLARSQRFDAAAARKSGYSDADLIDHLNKQVAGKQKARTAPGAGMAKALGAGVQQAATGIMGLPGDLIENATSSAMTGLFGITNALTGRGPTAQQGGDIAKGMVRAAGAPATTQRLDASRQAAFGQDYQPQTTPERYARTVGQFAAGAAVPGSMVRRAANVVLPAVASEAAGQRAEGTAWETPARVAGAIVGGIGAAGMTRARGEAKPPAPVKVNSKAPTLEQLQAQRTAAYKAVDQSGLTVKPEAVSDLSAGIKSELASLNIDDALHPAASRMMANIEKRAASGQPATVTEIDQFRRVVARDVAGKIDKGERLMGSRMIAKIDEFLDDLAPEQISGGDQTAVQSLKRARDMHSRVVKLERLDEAAEAAKDQAARTGSGGNRDNANRQQISSATRKMRGLTPDEQAAVKRAVRGTPVQNAARQVGKLSPEGNGLSLMLHAGALPMSGGLSAGVAVVGAVSKRIAEAISRQNVKALSELIADGGTVGRRAERMLAARAAKDANAKALYGRVMARVKGAPEVPAIAGRSAANSEIEDQRRVVPRP